MPVFTSASPVPMVMERAHRPREIARKRVVAAGIEENQARLRLTLHLLEHERERQGLEVDVPFIGQTRIDRDELVLPTHLNAMPGVEKQGHVGPLERQTELADRAFHRPLVEILTFGHTKPDALEGGRHVGSIVSRIAQLARV